jgi:hypothetical protein
MDNTEFMENIFEMLKVAHVTSDSDSDQDRKEEEVLAN